MNCPSPIAYQRLYLSKPIHPAQKPARARACDKEAIGFTRRPSGNSMVHRASARLGTTVCLRKCGRLTVSTAVARGSDAAGETAATAWAGRLPSCLASCLTSTGENSAYRLISSEETSALADLVR